MSDVLFKDLIAVLEDDATIGSLVGDKIYPEQAPQGAALPYLILTDISLIGDYNLAGASGIRQTRIQFDCYARLKSVSEDTKNQVLTLFDGRKQTLNSSTEVLSCVIENGQSSYDPKQGTYRHRVDLTFWHRVT